MIPRNNFDLFDDLFRDPFFSKSESKVMKTDIKETEDSYIINVDLPGYNKENIKLDITDGYLTINAKTDTENEEKDKKGKYIRKERYFGECSRSFYVGEELKTEDIEASFRNGTLKIEVPKPDEKELEKETKYIEIKD